MEKKRAPGSNPYENVDYYGKVQLEPSLNYQDFLGDMTPLIEEFKHTSQCEFNELSKASEELLIVLPKISKLTGKNITRMENNGKMKKDIVSSYVSNFMISTNLPDYWLNAEDDVKNVLCAMLLLRLESDGKVLFGELAVREFVRRKKLPEILVDKYMDFYGSMIKARMNDPVRSRSISLDANGEDNNYREELDAALDTMAEIIRDLGEDNIPSSYERDKFKEVFGVLPNSLATTADRHWGLTLSELVKKAKERAERI